MENSIRILHTGDWHIGNFPGPERNGENLRFRDICENLYQMVEEAHEIKPDVIVVAGDIFALLKNAFKMADSLDVAIVTEPEIHSFWTYRSVPVQIACIPGFDRGYYRAKHPGLSKEEENAVFTQAVERMIIGLKAKAAKQNPEGPVVLVSQDRNRLRDAGIHSTAEPLPL